MSLFEILTVRAFKWSKNQIILMSAKIKTLSKLFDFNIIWKPLMKRLWLSGLIALNKLLSGTKKLITIILSNIGGTKVFWLIYVHVTSFSLFACTLRTCSSSCASWTSCTMSLHRNYYKQYMKNSRRLESLETLKHVKCLETC